MISSLQKFIENLNKSYFFLKFKIYLKVYGFGNFFNNKPIGTQEDYIKLYNQGLNSQLIIKEFINNNFSKEEQEFINELALQTQITIKNSKLNFNHGFLIYHHLKNYLLKHKPNKIVILETGTARGFSAIIMSYLLSKFNIEYNIHTIDIIPHNKKIYWNCISDHTIGKISRSELLKDYKKYTSPITFHQGISRDVLKKLKLDRINFAFLDGSHEYRDVKIEYEYLNSKNLSGDNIFIDDFTPNQFNGVVKCVNEIKNQSIYDVKIFNSNKERGYAFLEKK